MSTSITAPTAMDASTGPGRRRLGVPAVLRQLPGVASAFDRTDPGRRRATWLVVDGLALLALCALVGVANLPAYGGGWLWVSVLGGGSVGLLLAWTSWRLRLNALGVLLLAVVAWFLTGTLLAMPASGIGRVLPTGRSLRGLAEAPVTAWRDMLTLDPPIGATWNLLCVPLLLAWLAALGGGLVSLRTRRPARAWLPAAVAIAASFALGTAASWRPLLAAVAAVLLVLGWTAYRRATQRTRLVVTGRRTAWQAGVVAAGMVTLAVALVALASPWLAATRPRATARARVAQPLRVDQYASPLQGFRANISQHRDDTLFTVSGLPADSALTVAVMDAWDGLAYRVTGSADPADARAGAGQFRRVGTRIAVPDGVQGTAVQAQVTVGAYSGVWVPDAGSPTRIRFSGGRGTALADAYYLDRASGTGLDTAGLASGDTYSFDSIVPHQPSNAQVDAADAAPLAQVPLADVPDTVAQLAQKWSASASTQGAKVRLLARTLHDQGWFSHGVGKDTVSLPGHNAARIASLLANPAEMVGDDEQYATTLALMARTLGVPARVAYGYHVPADGAVTGDDAQAWTQVLLQGLGWVDLFPTPSHDRVLKKPSADVPPQARPRVDTPLPPPKRPNPPPPDNQLPAQQANPPANRNPVDWAAIGRWTAVAAIPLVTIVLPVVAVLLLKRRRRQARRTNPVLANRFAGAWAEVVDRARDLGRSPSPNATRTEQAERLGAEFPQMQQHDPVGLARQADARVFGPEPVEPREAASYWDRTDGLLGGMRASVRPWRWLRSQLSIRSFRRRG